MFSREKRLLKRLSTGDAAFRMSVANDAKVPSGVLAALAYEVSVDVRLAVARNPSTPQDTIFALSHDEVRGVRDAALLRLLEQIGNTDASRIVRDVSSSPELVAAVAEDLGWSDLRNLCGNGYDPNEEFPKPRTEVLAKLAVAQNPQVRSEVAKSRFVTPEILIPLVTDRNDNVRKATVTNAARLSPEALSALVMDASSEIRRELAQGKATPPETLARLAIDESRDIRRDVAYNPNASDQILINLATDPDSEVRCAVAFGNSTVVLFGEMTTTKSYTRATPVEALLKLAADASPEVRKVVVRHPGLPIDAFNKLAHDPDDRVRSEVAAVIEYGYGDRRGRSTSGKDNEDSDFPVGALTSLGSCPHREIRLAVAQHPRIPAFLLAHLLDDDEVFDQDETDRQRDWSDRTLMPYSVLRDRVWDASSDWQVLTKISNSQARQALAYFPSTPHLVLLCLAEDGAELVRGALLENPRLSTEVLQKLVEDQSPSLADKAAAFLEQHSSRYSGNLGVFLDSKNASARAVVARDERAKEEWLEKLALDPEPAVRVAVATNSSTPSGIFSSLATDSNLDVSVAVAKAVQRSGISSETLDAVARSQHANIRAAVAAKPDVSESALRKLIEDPEEPVRLVAARNGYTAGASFLAALGMDHINKKFSVGQASGAMLCALAEDATLSVDAIHSLAQSPLDEVRCSVAKNPATTSSTLANLMRDKSSEVRVAVAGHSMSSKEILAVLARDDVAEVRRAVAANPSASSQVLALLDRDRDEGVALEVAVHPSTLPSSLRNLIDVHDRPRLSDSNSRLLSMLDSRMSVLDRLFPLKHLLSQQLTRSDKVWHQGVRQVVASNTFLSPEVLEVLSQQPDTVAFVSANPSTPAEVLSRLMRNEDELVRESLATNPNLPKIDLATLALDQSEAVRSKVAANPHTAVQTLKILVDDFSPGVKDIAQSALSRRT